MNEPTVLLLAALPGEFFLALAFVVLIGSIFVSRMLRKKRERNMGTFDDRDANNKIRTDLEELAVQVQEITREQIAKADVKIRMLNQLIMESEQKKQELENLLCQELPKPKKEESLPEEESARPENPLHEKVFSLSDAGKSATDICGETGLEIGEVEMILGIRKL